MFKCVISFNLPLLADLGFSTLFHRFHGNSSFLGILYALWNKRFKTSDHSLILLFLLAFYFTTYQKICCDDFDAYIAFTALLKKYSFLSLYSFFTSLAPIAVKFPVLTAINAKVTSLLLGCFICHGQNKRMARNKLLSFLPKSVYSFEICDCFCSFFSALNFLDCYFPNTSAAVCSLCDTLLF